MAKLRAELIGGPKDGAEIYLDSLPRFWYIPAEKGWRLAYEFRAGNERHFYYDFRGREATEEKTDA